jgi:opacity protein-like surface antigen
MVSAGAVAHAQGGWYGTAKVGAIVDGLQDIDAKSPVANGALDTRADLEVDPVYGIGLGYAYDNGLRLEGVFGYRNVDLDVPDTLVGTRPAGRVGPNGAGSTRVTDLMFNAIQDFKFEGSKITPYLGIGAGAARVNSRAASTFSRPAFHLACSRRRHSASRATASAAASAAVAAGAAAEAPSPSRRRLIPTMSISSSIIELPLALLREPREA